MKENNKCKSNKLFVIVIIVIAMALTFGCGLMLGKNLFDSKKDDKDIKKENGIVDNSQNNSTNSENNEKTISFLKNVHSEAKTYIGFEDGSFKSFDIAFENYYLDNNLLYYKNMNELYYINIDDENENPKKIDYSFDSIEDKFSIVDGVVYYFLKEDNNNYYAVSYNINSKKESKNKIDVDFVSSVNISDGIVGYFNGRNNITKSPVYYAYNFINNNLENIGPYSYIIENRTKTILFEKSKDNNSYYCLYDKENKKELFCINLTQFSEIKQEYVRHPVTTMDNSILLLSADKVLNCTSSTNCNNVLYTLSNEEKKSEYIDIFYYSNKLILIQGFDVECQGGCYANRYKYYDVLDNRKEYEFQFKYMGEFYDYIYFK